MTENKIIKKNQKSDYIYINSICRYLMFRHLNNISSKTKLYVSVVSTKTYVVILLISCNTH